MASGSKGSELRLKDRNGTPSTRRPARIRLESCQLWIDAIGALVKVGNNQSEWSQADHGSVSRAKEIAVDIQAIQSLTTQPVGLAVLVAVGLFLLMITFKAIKIAIKTALSMAIVGAVGAMAWWFSRGGAMPDLSAWMN
mgnify:CR=1 FL=1